MVQYRDPLSVCLSILVVIVEIFVYDLYVSATNDLFMSYDSLGTVKMSDIHI